MALRATIDRATPYRRAAVRQVARAGSLLALAVTLMIIAGAAPSLAETPPAQGDGGTASPQAPQRGGGAGGDGSAGPPLREDEPGPRGRDGRPAPDADEEASPPSGGGCPYRGRRLELIV